MIKLGVKARDKITGFEGIITGRAEYLYGCDQYSIVAESQDGKPGSISWFDEGRVEVLGDGIEPSSVQTSKPGGPQSSPPTR